jgi:methylmalonyl-CoA mutase cobalamin-binding subunit
VEDEETLEAAAVVGNVANAVQNWVDELAANGVTATSVVVGGVLFAGDQLLRIEKLLVWSSTNFVYN